MPEASFDHFQKRQNTLCVAEAKMQGRYAVGLITGNEECATATRQPKTSSPVPTRIRGVTTRHHDKKYQRDYLRHTFVTTGIIMCK